jgi:hypothetical protein
MTKPVSRRRARLAGRASQYFGLYEVSDEGTSWLGMFLFHPLAVVGLGERYDDGLRVQVEDVEERSNQGDVGSRYPLPRPCGCQTATGGRAAADAGPLG